MSKQDDSGNRLRIGRVKLSDLQPGPIRHDSLPPDLLADMKHVYEQVGKYVEPTLEQWEVGFMRDARPEGEVAVWKRIAKAYSDYRKQHMGGKKLRDSEAKRIVGLLSVISMGTVEAKQLKVPERMAARLVQCYLDTFEPEES